MKHFAPFLAGVLSGSLLLSGAANAVTAAAEKNRHTVYLDGRRVELDAYFIDGHNYVKLRDVGRLMGFNVYWSDGVRIQSGVPYTGEPPAPEPETADAAPETAETGNGRTLRLYRLFRESVLLWEELAGGTASHPPSALLTEAERQAAQDVSAALGDLPSYVPRQTDGGKTRIDVRIGASAEEAARAAAPDIARLRGATDGETVRALAFYLCDRMDYRADRTPTPRTVLTSGGVTPGNCMSYAHAFQILCSGAGIPCILVHSGSHQWNQVYADGAWRNVDVSAADAVDPSLRPLQTILWRDSELRGELYRVSDPETAAFAREILVPPTA